MTKGESGGPEGNGKGRELGLVTGRRRVPWETHLLDAIWGALVRGRGGGRRGLDGGLTDGQHFLAAARRDGEDEWGGRVRHVGARDEREGRKLKRRRGDEA